MWVESGYGQSVAETVSCGGGAQSETHYKWSNLKHFLNPYQWDQAGMGRWGIREKQGKNGLWSGGKAISCLWGEKKQHIALSLCSASFREKTFKCVSCWLFPPVPPHAVGAGAPCEAQVEKQQPLLFDKEKKQVSEAALLSSVAAHIESVKQTPHSHSLHVAAGLCSLLGLNSHHSLLPLAGDVCWIHLSKCITESVDLYLKVLIILITAQYTRLFNFCTYKTTDSLSAICIYILFTLTTL